MDTTTTQSTAKPKRALPQTIHQTSSKPGKNVPRGSKKDNEDGEAHR